MALERTRASQVVTLAPQQPLWAYTITSAGAYSTATWARPFIGLPFIVVGTYSSGTPIAAGDKFQLYTGASLKESTVFTVQGVTPSTGYNAWNIFFNPSPLAIPTNADTARSLAAPKSPRWLGSLGHVTNLNYAFTCPGGPSTMSCLLRLPPSLRTDALDPGRVVQIWRGAQCCWEGKLNEPTPANEGWTITAHGAGTYGDDFVNFYSTWNADDPVNKAIGRGLRWANPGIGTPASIFLSQIQDSGSQTITAFLNLLCTGGALLWQVVPNIASTLPAPSWTLKVFPFRTDANGNPIGSADLILLASSPVARTVTADITEICVRFQATADIPATGTKAAIPATFATIFADNNASVTKHGRMEYYLDITSAGVLTGTNARAYGQYVLQKFVRANYAGSYTVGPGQLMNIGGVPVDLGIGQAGQLAKVMVTDASLGGEVAAAPMTFMIGTYEYDDDTSTATVTPYQGVRGDIASVISSRWPVKF